MDMYKVSGASRFWLCIEIDVPYSDKVLDIVKDFICSSDLFRKLPFMYHSSSSKKRKNKYIS